MNDEQRGILIEMICRTMSNDCTTFIVKRLKRFLDMLQYKCKKSNHLLRKMGMMIMRGYKYRLVLLDKQHRSVMLFGHKKNRRV